MIQLVQVKSIKACGFKHIWFSATLLKWSLKVNIK